MTLEAFEKLLSRRRALNTLRAGAVAGALVSLNPTRVAADDDVASAVVGSWLIRSGPEDKLAITSLITYTAQGACVQTTVSHPRRSPAMGVWTRLGGREFAATFESFVFDADGHFTNVSQVRVQSTMGDSLDHYDGRFQTFTLDEEGNAIRLDNSGLVAATRIQFARLDPTG